MNDENLTFLSASEFGSYLTSNRRSWGKPSSAGIAGGYVPTDFAGMNTNIQEPVSSPTNTLGYPLGTRLVSSSYGQNAYVNASFVPFTVHDPFNNMYFNTFMSGAQAFNALILHRQGPYGWPTWKQIRGGDHPIVRYQKKNNIFSLGNFLRTKNYNDLPLYTQDIFPGKNPLGMNPLAGNLIVHKGGEVISDVGDMVHYQLPCVSDRYLPLQHSFHVSQDKEGVPQTVELALKHSYGNIESHYSDEKLNLKFVFPQNYPPKIDTIYNDLEKIYITKVYAADATPDNPFGKEVPFKKLNAFVYSEKIFPKQSNSYFARTRKRTKYAETASFNTRGFNRRDYENTWVSSFSGSRSIRTPAAALNSQNYTTVEITSSWSLDTSVPSTTRGVRLRLGNGIGELSTPLGYHSTESTTSGSYTQTASVNSFRFPAMHHKPNPDAESQFSRGIPNYATNLISGKRPFFDSYDDFIEDIRGIGKDYSVLPEFRISDHMDYYINEKEGDFLSLNQAFLNLKWGNISSSADEISDPTSDLNQNFFVEYTNSDFMKYFGKFFLDHATVSASIDQYSFAMKGIKKLLPYRGFYPHQRALQLGTILSQSFGPNLTGAINPSYGAATPFTPAAIETGRLSAFLRPLISPGIIFNSLKSSIAVDYPVFTGSIGSARVARTGDHVAGRGMWFIEPNFRLPFETAIQPHIYFPVSSSDAQGTGKNAIFFDEPIRDATGTPNVMVSWSGDYANTYSLAANNFFGEIPRFFLKNEKFTDFISKKEAEFKEVEAGKFYYMDVVLRKTDKMVLWEGQLESAGGFLTGSNERGMFYGPPLSSSYASNINGGRLKDPAYAAYTPPYFYQKAIARLVYVPTAGGKPTVDDILTNIQLHSYYTGSHPQLIGGSGDTAGRNAMMITASVNLFGKSRYKQVKFDPQNVDPQGNFEPTSLDDTSDGAFTAWTIGSKFECPALNFFNPTDWHSPTTGRGLWGGYGVLPSGSEGVFIDIQESYPDQIFGAAAPTTGSLIDICGFQAASKKIGKVAPAKTISEAVIAIPFVYKPSPTGFATTLKYPNTEKRFFKVHLPKFDKAKKELSEGILPADATSPSIANMIAKLGNYNMPPRYDFLTFPLQKKQAGLNPFVAYVFEFSHTLSQQDLMDIWQGLMPTISNVAEEEEVVVSHKNNKNEFFHGKPLPPDTRWMLFKVKRKAEKSYFAVTADSQDDSRFKFQFGNEEKPPEYNYNWPYDFFSLVELVKMENSVQWAPPLQVEGD